MKKISAKVFFTVLWRGLCQALGWFFGLFGYKRKGKLAQCVWGVFAVSSAIVMAFIACGIVYAVWNEVSRQYFRHHCDLSDCYHSQQISGGIYYHNTWDVNGYVYNSYTNEKTLTHVRWVSSPFGKDSLVCFSNGKKRGYFNKNTGKVVIKPKYDHAWVFSEGLAAVDEGGTIKFINPAGETVIDNKTPYLPGINGYVFHGGYCVVNSSDGERLGLMDKKGEMALPFEYSYICMANDFKLWRIEKGHECGVLDNDLNTIVPLTECSMWISEGTIDLTMPDHTMRKYDPFGKLINDFYIANVRTLEYTKDEVLYRTDKTTDDEGNVVETSVEAYHPVAPARMRAYVAGEGYEGLMTVDGHIVTMPLYKDISAIGYDLYLCEVTNGDHVIINGKGEIVK